MFWHKNVYVVWKIKKLLLKLHIKFSILKTKTYINNILIANTAENSLGPFISKKWKWVMHHIVCRFKCALWLVSRRGQKNSFSHNSNVLLYNWMSFGNLLHTTGAHEQKRTACTSACQFLTFKFHWMCLPSERILCFTSTTYSRWQNRNHISSILYL